MNFMLCGLYLTKKIKNQKPNSQPWLSIAGNNLLVKMNQNQNRNTKQVEKKANY